MRTSELPQVHETLVHMLAATVERVPERDALVLGSTRLTYRDYLACTAGFARELQQIAGEGLRGERVAILLPNSIETCIVQLAVLAAGAQVVPLNPMYTARELGEILDDAAPLVVVFDAARAGDIEPLRARLAIPHALALTPGDGRLTRWQREPVALPPLPPSSDLAYLQYTGGTTGRPKGVMLTHRAVATNVSQREAILPTGRDGERVLCTMPLFHIYALAMGLFLSAYAGAALVIQPRYRPDDLLRLIEEQRITIFLGSPTLFTGLMGFASFDSVDFSRLHTCYSGSAPLPEETLRRWEQATGAPIYEGYGQTEAGPVIAFQPLHGERIPGSTGIAVGATEIQIVDAQSGEPLLPPGQVGEIQVRGPQLMQGYRNRPEETAAALRNGWLYTGDIGELDANGYLYIRDRKKDMVIVGGYNVYPREIDEVLASHPDVQEAATIGVPDAYRGEVVKAYVVLRPGARTSTEALLTHCSANLAKYKVPAALTVVPELPKTPVGKIDKKTLKEAAK